MRRKPVVFREGKTLFSRRGERTFFFALTLLMLLWGVLAKLGLFC